MNMCQIIHIPDKPPIPPNEQPTVNVFASVVEPKLANTIIRRLNQVAPLENLRHVKRIQKKFLEGGKTQLSVILCLADENDNQVNSFLQDIQELVDSHQLSPFITKLVICKSQEYIQIAIKLFGPLKWVCKYAALSKEEWEEQCKLWPTSYHPPAYNIDGITGFSEEDSQSIFGSMKFAIELAKSGDGSIVNAAVIMDPSVKQVIASGHDQICYCSKQPEVQLSHPSNDSPGEIKQPYPGVSCLNPWQWTQQKSHINSCYWHPLRHAAMTAIESSAARDRCLYPVMELDGDKSNGVDNVQSSATGFPVKRQKSELANVENGEEMDSNAKGLCPMSTRPYLCTGYDIYLVWEPCVMCAMALVHQRVRRIFYAFPNLHAGALGSVHRLQGEKSLNHHYAVFRVVLPEEVLYMDEIAAVRFAKND